MISFQLLVFVNFENDRNVRICIASGIYQRIKNAMNAHKIYLLIDLCLTNRAAVTLS